MSEICEVISEDLLGSCVLYFGHTGEHAFRERKPRSPMKDCFDDIAKGLKYDTNKPLPSLLPPKAIQSVIKVLTFGAKKYSRENWRNVEGLQERYLDALMRHLFSYHGGEVNDPETDLPHLAHAVCCALYLIEDAADEEAV